MSYKQIRYYSKGSYSIVKKTEASQKLLDTIDQKTKKHELELIRDSQWNNTTLNLEWKNHHDLFFAIEKNNTVSVYNRNQWGRLEKMFSFSLKDDYYLRPL